jgi:hypothetical protein
MKAIGAAGRNYEAEAEMPSSHEPLAFFIYAIGVSNLLFNRIQQFLH